MLLPRCSKYIASCISLILLVPQGASAQGSKPAGKPAAPSAAPAKEEKLDVSDLEKKYWSAKDTDFSVVQNRLYTKAGRLSLTPFYGTLINESWQTGPVLALTANYYLSERYGVQFSYQRNNSSSSDAANRLNQMQGGGFPNHNLLKGFYGASFNWVPFYAKVSVLNSQIIYFDMSFSPGLGMVQYDQQREQGANSKSSMAFSLDITQQFFLNNWFALRFDFINRWFPEEVVAYKQASQATVAPDNSMGRTTILLFGATFFF